MSSVANSIYVGTVSNQLGLYRFQEGVVEDMLAVLLDARLDILEQVRRSIERGKDQTYTGVRLARLSREIDGAVAEAYRTLGRELEASLSDLADRAVSSSARVIEDALPFTFHMTRPDPGLLAAIATTDPFDGAVLSGHVSKLEASMRAELLRASRAGMTLGETTDQIVRRIRGTEAAGFGDGALALSYHQARSVTRTAVQHVHAEARDRLYLDNQDVVIGQMGVVTLDERTCRICGPRDGLVWRLPDYTPDGHEVEWSPGAGRWHMQCRCTSIAVLGPLSAFEDAGADLSGLTDGERAAMDAPVSVKVDYDDWLRSTATRDEQNRALGPRRADWWRDNPTVSLADAWARRFGGIPVERETLDAVLPPAGRREFFQMEIPRFESESEAIRWIEQNLSREVDLNRPLQDLQDIADGMGAAINRAGLADSEFRLRGLGTDVGPFAATYNPRAHEVNFNPQIMAERGYDPGDAQKKYLWRRDKQIESARRVVESSEAVLAGDGVNQAGRDLVQNSLDRAREKLERLEAATRYTVSTSGSRPTMLTAAHELAHALHLEHWDDFEILDEFGDLVDVTGRRAWEMIVEQAKAAGDWTDLDEWGISEYATSAPHELFAELMAHVVNGGELGPFESAFERMLHLIRSGSEEDLL